MARYSESLIRALTSPTYGRGLFTAAQNVGQIPRQMRAQQQAERERQLLASIDPNTVQGLRQLAAFYQAKGDVANATKYAEQARQRLSTGMQTLETGQQEIEKEVNRKRLARQVSELARSRGQTALSIAAESMPEEALVKYLTGETSGDAFASTRGATSPSFPRADIWEDVDGNQFYAATPTSGATFGVSYAPVDPAGPQTPAKGKLQLVSRGADTPGLTSGGITAVEAERQDIEAWGGQREEVYADASEARKQLPRLTQMRNLLTSIKTAGGETGTFEGPIKDMLAGTGFEQYNDYRELQIAINQQITNGLREAFGAQLSDGERQAFAKTLASLENPLQINETIVTNALSMIDKKLQLEQWLVDNPASKFDGDFLRQRAAYINYSNALFGYVEGRGATETPREIDLRVK